MSRRPKKNQSGSGFAEFRREIEGGRIQPLYLFEGPEQYLQQQALSLLSAIVDESLRVFNVSKFSIGADNRSGSKTTVAMAIDAANQVPMMSARRIVVVRDLDKIREDELELVLSYLKSPAPTTTMVFQAVALDRRRKLTTALLKACSVVSFGLLKESAAERWAQDRLKLRGCDIEPGALNLLTSLAGTGLTRLTNELEKLAAYADGAVIKSATVQELVMRASEHTNWELWTAINERNRKRALKLMERLLDDTDALPILGALASLYRRLLTGKQLQEGGASSREIGQATGQWNDAFLSQVRRSSRAELVQALRRIAEVDDAIKNSLATPRLLMQYLIVELTGK